MRGKRNELEPNFGCDRERAFASDEKLRQVVAGGVFEKLASVLDHFA